MRSTSAHKKTYIHVRDVWQVLSKLEDHQLAAMNDPRRATGRIHTCSSESNRTPALSKLSRAESRARKALEADRAGDDATAFYYLGRLFGGKFPSRY